MKIRLENVRVKPCIKAHDSGRVHLAYVDATVVIPEALPDGSDFMITVPDISVAVTADGHNVVDFKSRVATVNGAEKRFPYVFTRNAESRAWLTETLHALPEVNRLLAKALVARDEVLAAQAS